MYNRKNCAPSGVLRRQLHDADCNGQAQNGVEGPFGRINLMQGLDTHLEMCFVETGTDEPRTIEHFFMTFFDFDMGKGTYSNPSGPKAEVL